jgi:hypothetical protein
LIRTWADADPAAINKLNSAIARRHTNHLLVAGHLKANGGSNPSSNRGLISPLANLPSIRGLSSPLVKISTGHSDL